MESIHRCFRLYHNDLVWTSVCDKKLSNALEKSRMAISKRIPTSTDANRSFTVVINWVSQEWPFLIPCCLSEIMFSSPICLNIMLHEFTTNTCKGNRSIVWGQAPLKKNWANAVCFRNILGIWSGPLALLIFSTPLVVISRSPILETVVSPNLGTGILWSSLTYTDWNCLFWRFAFWVGSLCSLPFALMYDQNDLILLFSKAADNLLFTWCHCNILTLWIFLHPGISTNYLCYRWVLLCYIICASIKLKI